MGQSSKIIEYLLRGTLNDLFRGVGVAGEKRFKRGGGG